MLSQVSLIKWMISGYLSLHVPRGGKGAKDEQSSKLGLGFTLSLRLAPLKTRGGQDTLQEGKKKGKGLGLRLGSVDFRDGFVLA